MSELIKCKACNHDVSINAASCPNCGEKPKKKTKWLFGCSIFVIGFIIMLIVIGIISEPTTVSKSTVLPSTVPATTVESLELLKGWKVETGEYGTTTITGKVKNNTSKQYSYVQIQFNVYDKSGSQLGSAMANINNLEPNGTWKFNAVCVEEGIATARFKDVSGW
jgi:hypothetical protein